MKIQTTNVKVVRIQTSRQNLDIHIDRHKQNLDIHTDRHTQTQDIHPDRHKQNLDMQTDRHAQTQDIHTYRRILTSQAYKCDSARYLKRRMFFSVEAAAAM